MQGLKSQLGIRICILTRSLGDLYVNWSLRRIDLDPCVDHSPETSIYHGSVKARYSREIIYT